jgi:hypothetical protein
MPRIEQLRKSMKAWNMDGSSTDKCQSADGTNVSWIKHWENATGKKRTVCSYADCSQRGQHGGHIWIKGKGVYIAPICKDCNSPRNARRMQNANNGQHSNIRRGTTVVQTDFTEDMACAERRIAEPERTCELCCDDISQRPSSHTLCLSCFMEESRRCVSCRGDISQRPSSHTLCLPCFRGLSLD